MQVQVLSSALQSGQWFTAKAEAFALWRLHALHLWVYPAVCFAAHTGARRSEIIRAHVADVDLDGNTVLIREKKRRQRQRTTRRVPLTPFLKNVLRKWLAIHPGGPHLFCHGEFVERSRKRSRTTGHKGEKTRDSSSKGRLSGVQTRVRPAPSALTRDEIHDHFKRTLRESKWEMVRGLHCLRHSFISACASKGVDQRLVQERRRHGAPVSAAKLTPQTAWEHYAVGRALLRLGELDAAALEIDRAVQLDPQALWPNFYQGVCSYRRGHFLEAAAAFGVAIGAAPNAAGCFFNRALAFAALGRPELAVRDYDQSLRLDPSLTSAVLEKLRPRNKQ